MVLCPYWMSFFARPGENDIQMSIVGKRKSYIYIRA